MVQNTDTLTIRSPDLSKMKQDTALVFGLMPSQATCLTMGKVSLLTSNEKAWAIADDVIAKKLSKDYCLNLEPFRKVTVNDMSLLPEINKLINQLSASETLGNILNYTDLTGFTHPDKTVYVRVSNWRVSLIVYRPL